jgi:23S rRNA A2030 N6-methylase RlmJ
MKNHPEIKLPSIGVALHRVQTLNILTRVTANPTNCCGFYIIWYPIKSPQQFAGFAVALVKIFKF